MGMRLLVIDHRDSYSHLLHQLFWQVTGIEPHFMQASDANFAALQMSDWDAAILSPGPGHPANEADFGPTARFLSGHSRFPILGICLGHQGMAHAFGARIIALPKPWHGRASLIEHQGTELFKGMPPSFPAIRYHSLIVEEASLSRHLQVTARAKEDGSVQGLRFIDKPWWSVQFHPESIGTIQGKRLAENFLGLVNPKALGSGTSFGMGSDSFQTTIVPPIPTEIEKPIAIGHGSAISPENMAAWVKGGQVAADNSSHTYEPYFFYWLDPQVTRELDDATFLASGQWPTTRMGKARYAILLFPWGLQWVKATSQKSNQNEDQAQKVNGYQVLAEWRGHPLQGLQFLRGPKSEKRLDTQHLALIFGMNLEVDSQLDMTLDWIGCFHYELGALTQDGSSAWLETLPDETILGAWLIPDIEWHWEFETQDWKCRWAKHYHPGTAEERLTLVTPNAVKPGLQEKPSPPEPMQVSLSRTEYQAAFQAIQKALYQGDTYEACLTFTVQQKSAANPFIVYRELRSNNPAPFGAYIELPHATMLSSSPELFLSGTSEGQLTSKPIKGTRRRGHSPQTDAALRSELAAHPKDRAENLMITDLVRNDLSRVCRPGSVQVTSFQALEPHPHVFQMVTTVQGQLREGLNWLQALNATFPGGSMTGAPKPRTLQLLQKWEARPRGIYSGAFGTLGADQSFQWAMTIRTWVFSQGIYAAGCGGAIVIDSEEDSEWKEAWLKIEALQRALKSAEISLENP